MRSVSLACRLCDRRLSGIAARLIRSPHLVAAPRGAPPQRDEEGQRGEQGRRNVTDSGINRGWNSGWQPSIENAFYPEA